MKTRLSIVVVVAAVTTMVLGAARATDDPRPAPKSDFSVEQARAFRDFPVYSAGRSVDGIPLVAVLRRTNGPNYVSFIYGECRASDEMACAPPGEVQVWPACARNISMYDSALGPPFTPSEVRGAPAFLFEQGRRLEVQTGESTIVIFARTPALAKLIATRLEGVNVAVRAAERLPAPAEGALEGGLRCP
jgi:hypothetical protein